MFVKKRKMVSENIRKRKKKHQEMLFKKWGKGLGRQVKINIPCKKDHWFRELSQRRGKGRQCEVERGERLRKK